MGHVTTTAARVRNNYQRQKNTPIQVPVFTTTQTQHHVLAASKDVLNQMDSYEVTNLNPYLVLDRR